MQRMDRLRRSLRDSFRRKREAPESTKPHQWQADEEAVRQGTCTFHVKYLGCVEVFESRGMNVCEEAMRVLRQSRRRPVKSVLSVSGDGLRVVEDDTKGLIVDQTIEKVSFCAPDRNHERGFSYICRDGTTRRWMCHGFLSSKDSGERLSHAVGCAFAACLERKQKREKECGVSMTFDAKTSTFTRSGSFRVTSMTDSLNQSPPPLDPAGNNVPRSSSVTNTKAIERPHAPVKMLERQGSFRGFSQLANQSPFKRQLSLRLSDLPSNIQRAQNNVDILTNNNVIIPTEPLRDPLVPIAKGSYDLFYGQIYNNNNNDGKDYYNANFFCEFPPYLFTLSTTVDWMINSSQSPAAPPRNSRNRLHSLPNNSIAGAIPETTPAILPKPQPNLQQLENKDLVSELCQQVSQGLSLLAANHDDVKNTSQFSTKFTNPWDDEDIPQPAPVPATKPPTVTAPLTQTRPALPFFNSINVTNNPSIPTTTTAVSSTIRTSSLNKTNSNGLIGAISTSSPSKTEQVSSKIVTGTPPPNRPPAPLPSAAVSSITAEPSSSPKISNITATTSSSSTTTAPVPPVNPSRPPLLTSGSVVGRPVAPSSYRGAPSRAHSLGADPFDASWAAPQAKQGTTATNPFNRQQTFQISM